MRVKTVRKWEKKRVTVKIRDTRSVLNPFCGA
jgi:hypothetical protein